MIFLNLFLPLQGCNDEEILLDEEKTVRFWEHFDVKTMKISPSEKVLVRHRCKVLNLLQYRRILHDFANDLHLNDPPINSRFLFIYSSLHSLWIYQEMIHILVF